MRLFLFPLSLGAFMVSWFISANPRRTAEAAASAALPRLDPSTAAAESAAGADRAVPLTRASRESGIKGERLYAEAQEMISAGHYADAEKTLDLALTMGEGPAFKERALTLRVHARRGQGNIKGALEDMRDACLIASGTICRDYEMAIRGTTGLGQ